MTSASFSTSLGQTHQEARRPNYDIDPLFNEGNENWQDIDKWLADTETSLLNRCHAPSATASSSSSSIVSAAASVLSGPRSYPMGQTYSGVTPVPVDAAENAACMSIPVINKASAYIAPYVSHQPSRYPQVFIVDSSATSNPSSSSASSSSAIPSSASASSSFLVPPSSPSADTPQSAGAHAKSILSLFVVPAPLAKAPPNSGQFLSSTIVPVTLLSVSLGSSSSASSSSSSSAAASTESSSQSALALPAPSIAPVHPSFLPHSEESDTERSVMVLIEPTPFMDPPPRKNETFYTNKLLFRGFPAGHFVVRCIEGMSGENSTGPLLFPDFIRGVAKTYPREAHPPK